MNTMWSNPARSNPRHRAPVAIVAAVAEIGSFTRMKTSTRRLIGAAILGISIVSPVALALSGAWSRVLETHTETSGFATVTSVVVESHWPPWLCIVLLSTAVVGVLLLLLPSREKTNA